MTVFRPGAANVPTDIEPSLYGVEVTTYSYHGSISRLSPAPKARFQGKPLNPGVLQGVQCIDPKGRIIMLSAQDLA